MFLAPWADIPKPRISAAMSERVGQVDVGAVRWSGSGAGLALAGDEATDSAAATTAAKAAMRYRRIWTDIGFSSGGVWLFTVASEGVAKARGGGSGRYAPIAPAVPQIQGPNALGARCRRWCGGLPAPGDGGVLYAWRRRCPWWVVGPSWPLSLRQRW